MLGLYLGKVLKEESSKLSPGTIIKIIVENIVALILGRVKVLIVLLKNIYKIMEDLLRRLSVKILIFL